MVLAALVVHAEHVVHAELVEPVVFVVLGEPVALRTWGQGHDGHEREFP